MQLTLRSRSGTEATSDRHPIGHEPRLDARREPVEVLHGSHLAAIARRHIRDRDARRGREEPLERRGVEGPALRQEREDAPASVVGDDQHAAAPRLAEPARERAGVMEEREVTEVRDRPSHRSPRRARSRRRRRCRWRHGSRTPRAGDVERAPNHSRSRTGIELDTRSGTSAPKDRESTRAIAGSVSSDPRA